MSGADHNGRPIAIFEDADETVPTDVLGDGEADRPQLLGQALGGLFFLRGKLGVGVNVLIKFDEVADLRFRRLFHFGNEWAWCGNDQSCKNE